MRKLTALTTFILEKTGLPREQVHAFADQGELVPIGKHLGPLWPENGEPLEQIQIGLWKYDGVIQMESYPGPGPSLAALVLGWLADNDADRSHLATPALNVDINDENSCDVELSLEFEEFLTTVEAPEGPIFFNGKRWALAEAEITPAENFNLSAQVK